MGKRKHNIPMCMALALLFLTMVTTHMTGGLYARYTGYSEGSDTARVAKFQVLSSPEKEAVTVDCATQQNGVYSFTVTNHSEVAVQYSITVIVKQQIPATMLQIALDSSEYGYLGQGNAITFPMNETLDPLGDSAAHELHFRVTEKEFFDSVQGEESAKLELDFTVTVHSEQID